MSFQDEPGTIVWRLHLSSPPQQVFELLSTDEGRAKFWAEAAVEHNGVIEFSFANGQSWQGRILAREAPSHFSMEYIGGTEAKFWLEDDGGGGTELTLRDEGIPEADRSEVAAGWVSVLMALKAAADYSVDLRNHDPGRTWDEGYAEN